MYRSLDPEIKVQRCTECESKGPFTVNMEQILRRAAQKEIQRNLKKGLEQLFRKPKP